MALELITNFYLPQVVLNFLKTPIFSSVSWFDYWMLIHLVAGVLLIFFIGRMNIKLALILLIGFEIFEWVLFGRGLAIPEVWINTVGDIGIGTLGYYWGSLFL